MPVAIMVLGLLLGIPLVVTVVGSIGGFVSERSYETPTVIRKSLGPGRYVIFERTGTNRSTGPITTSDPEAPTLTTESARVRGPDGVRVPLAYMRSNETITQGSAVYTGVLVFEAARKGDYEISVIKPGRSVLVARSLGETFRDFGRPFVVAFIGGLVFMTGGAMLAFGALRRRPGQPAVSAYVANPPAGWYADPSGSGLRYWDGSAWTEHLAP